MRRIILASASPRRKELLSKYLKFKIDISNFDESSIDQRKYSPIEFAKHLSLQKAKEVAKKYKDAVIIAADTLVVLDDEILGKPSNEKHAREMLEKLSGKMHLVITGFTIIDTKTKKTSTKSVETKVYFRKISEDEIDQYVQNGEPLGKAGAYGIQDKAGIFVEKIEGDFFNVVGLPLCALFEELKRLRLKLIIYPSGI
ncbi:MAG: Maf family protein [bacterium]|nr:Maf family protein [bacterium]